MERIVKEAGFRKKYDKESIEHYRLSFSEYSAEQGDFVTALDFLPYGVGQDKEFVMNIQIIPDSYKFMTKVETAALLSNKPSLLNLVRQGHSSNK